MKNYLLPVFIFLVSASNLVFAQTNDQPIFLKVNTASIYGESVPGTFEGHLDDFINSNFFNHEYSSGELHFALIDDSAYFKKLQNIARFFWKYLSNNANVTPPYPCGQHLIGTIKEGQKNNNEGLVTFFEIVGRGDGSFDSCSGIGGPGQWLYKMTIEFDPNNLTGLVNYSFEEE